MNSLPKTVTRQRRDCDLNPGPSAPESNTLTARLPSHPFQRDHSEKHFSEMTYPNCIFIVFFMFKFVTFGGSVAEWIACWTQAQKGPGSNRSRDAVG